jgi:hypothetical protein
MRNGGERDNVIAARIEILPCIVSSRRIPGFTSRRTLLYFFFRRCERHSSYRPAKTARKT